jgi:hypothetical protein
MNMKESVSKISGRVKLRSELRGDRVKRNTSKKVWSGGIWAKFDALPGDALLDRRSEGAIDGMETDYES